jgi:acyl dehydratase
MANRYFDDFQVGERFVSRDVTLSEAEILDFALRYDRFCRVANSAQSDLR